MRQILVLVLVIMVLGLAGATGATVLVVPPSVGGVKEAADFFGLFDYNVTLLANALKAAGGE